MCENRNEQTSLGIKYYHLLLVYHTVKARHMNRYDWISVSSCSQWGARTSVSFLSASLTELQLASFPSFSLYFPFPPSFPCISFPMLFFLHFSFLRPFPFLSFTFSFTGWGGRLGRESVINGGREGKEVREERDKGGKKSVGGRGYLVTWSLVTLKELVTFLASNTQEGQSILTLPFAPHQAPPSLHPAHRRNPGGLVNSQSFESWQKGLPTDAVYFKFPLTFLGVCHLGEYCQICTGELGYTQVYKAKAYYNLLNDSVLQTLQKQFWFTVFNS